MAEQPLVSIVTPVYNGAQYLEGLIQSVLKQDYTNIEHIIIDDGSTDNGATVAVLKRYPHLRWWSRENKGQYATMNEGLVAATGDFVGFISADDMYITPSAISRAMTFWQSNQDCKYIYGRTIQTDSNGVPLPIQTATLWRFPRWLLRYFLCISHSALFVDREVLLKNSLWFDPSLRYAGDWDWVIRLANTGYRFGYVGAPLSLGRHHSGQTTQTSGTEKLFREYRKVCERYGTNFTLFLFCRKGFQYFDKLRKIVWSLRSDGVMGLYSLMRNWKNRQSARY